MARLGPYCCGILQLPAFGGFGSRNEVGRQFLSDGADHLGFVSPERGVRGPIFGRDQEGVVNVAAIVPEGAKLVEAAHFDLYRRLTRYTKRAVLKRPTRTKQLGLGK